MVKETPVLPNVVRSSAGLRDAIFDEIDALRNGTSNATRSNAISKLAMTVVETVRMEIEVQRYATAAATQAQVVNGAMPPSLTLGG